jgi:hypothetical protein
MPKSGKLLPMETTYLQPMTSVSPASQNGKGKWSSPSGREINRNLPEQGRGITRILTSWRAFRDSLAPLGYEDETGFHYGDRPEEG